MYVNAKVALLRQVGYEGVYNVTTINVTTFSRIMLILRASGGHWY